MQDVKWIKLYTSLPNNRKIKQLMKLPNGPVYVCVWVFLMCLAGEVNDNGSVYFTEELPYTDEMLADQFDLPVKVVRQALQLFEKFEMIEIIDDAIRLRNWEKYQASDRLGKIKEQDRIRAKAYRERKKIAQNHAKDNVTRHVTDNVTVTDNHATEEEIREENKNTPLRECNAPARESVTKKHIETDDMVIFLGEYGNVIMKPEEYLQLQEDFPNDYKDRIDNLSRYMKSKGVDYDDHYATIRKWAIEDAKKNKTGSGGKSNAFSYEDQRDYTSDEYADLELKMRQRRTGAPEKGEKHD